MKATAEAHRQADSIQEEELSYVLVPADASKPLQELTFRPEPGALGDLLVDILKPAFRGSGDKIDTSLLQKQATQTLSTSSDTRVSEAALQQVAAEANVEIFPLVQATPGNKFTGVNIYLDEVGMLKRLPLNKRASDYANHAGFNPPPQFYGDVFLGRVRKKPSIRNLSFRLGPDTAMDATWLQAANTENLVHQLEMNRITGRNETQPEAVGDGKAKQEDGFAWTQTEEELEVSVSLAADATSKDVQVKFRPQSIDMMCKKESVLSIKLFERVDVDGCTWTLEKSGNDRKLVVTMEKVEEAFWPRIQD